MYGVDSFGTRYAEGYFLTYGIIVVLEHKGRTWRLYIHAIGRKPRRSRTRSNTPRPSTFKSRRRGIR